MGYAFVCVGGGLGGLLFSREFRSGGLRIHSIDYVCAWSVCVCVIMSSAKVWKRKSMYVWYVCICVCTDEYACAGVCMSGMLRTFCFLGSF